MTSVRAMNFAHQSFHVWAKVVALAVRIAERVKKQLQHVPELKPLMSA